MPFVYSVQQKKCYNARMTSRSLRSAVLLTSLLLLDGLAFSQQKILDANVVQKLATQYPGEQILKWCDGSFLGKPNDKAVALHNAAQKRYRIVWVAKGTVQELQAIPAFGEPSQFELQCLDPGKAGKIKRTLGLSETIHDFLRLPTGKGALCYFVEQTETKCWSVDRKGLLIDAGGWQT